MNIRSFKIFGLIFLISAVVFTFSACDMLSSDEAEEAESAYNVEMVVDVGAVANLQDDADQISDQLKVRDEQDFDSYSFEEEDGTITGEIKGLRGSTTVEIYHEQYEGISAYLRLSPDTADTPQQVELQGGSETIEFTYDSVALHEELDREIFQFEVEDAEEEFGWLEGIAFMDKNDNVVSRKDLQENIYASERRGDDVDLRFALYDADDQIVATAEGVAPAGEESLELELDFSGAENFSDLGLSALSEDVEIQRRGEYLAKKQLDSEKEGVYPLEVDDGGHHGPLSFPDSYFVLEGTLYEWDYVIDDNGNDKVSLSSEFEDEFRESARNNDFQFAEMGIYIKDDTDGQVEDHEGNTVDEEDLKMNIVEDRVNDGGEVIDSLVHADIEVEKHEVTDDMVPYFEVTVNEVQGLDDAESFTVGRDSEASDNTPYGFGTTARLDTEYDDDEWEPIHLFILGEEPEEFDEDGEISTPAQLKAALENHKNDGVETYELVQDINMEEVEDWEPVGSQDTHFEDTFDGNDHRIFNLDIDHGNNSHAGLFGYIGEGGEVKDLKLENITVSGNRYVGVVAGVNAGDIENVDIEEWTVDNQDEYSGGIAGLNLADDSIEDVTVANGDVTSNNRYAGGAAGYNEGSIDNVTVESDVSVTGVKQIGGMVGVNEGDEASIENSSSYATDVSAEDGETGGFVGVNEGSIEDSHVGREDEAVSVDGGDGNRVGGFVGYNDGEGDIENVHTIADVSGFNSIGGIVGENNADIDNKEARYSVVNVTAEDYNAGGIVGHNHDDGSIDSGEIRGSVSGLGNVGSVAGRNNDDAELEGTFRVHEDFDIDPEEYEDVSVGHGDVANDADVRGFMRLDSLSLDIDDEPVVDLADDDDYISWGESEFKIYATLSDDEGNTDDHTPDADILEITSEDTGIEVVYDDENNDDNLSGTIYFPESDLSDVEIEAEYEYDGVVETDTATVDVEFPYGSITFDDQQVKAEGNNGYNNLEGKIVVEVNEFGYTEGDTVHIDLEWYDEDEDKWESITDNGMQEFGEDDFNDDNFVEFGEDELDLNDDPGYDDIDGDDLRAVMYNEDNNGEGRLDTSTATIDLVDIDISVNNLSLDDGEYAGETLTFSFEVENNGEDDAEDVEVELIAEDYTDGGENNGEDYTIGEDEIDVDSGETETLEMTFDTDLGDAYDGADNYLEKVKVEVNEETTEGNFSGDFSGDIDKPVEIDDVNNNGDDNEFEIELTDDESDVVDGGVFVRVYDEDDNAIGSKMNVKSGDTVEIEDDKDVEDDIEKIEIMNESSDDDIIDSKDGIDWNGT